jgi:hypothetical protein
MSQLKYSTYEGAGEFLTNLLGYSQTVRIGDRLEISGQGELLHHINSHHTVSFIDKFSQVAGLLRTKHSASPRHSWSRLTRLSTTLTRLSNQAGEKAGSRSSESTRTTRQSHPKSAKEWQRTIRSGCRIIKLFGPRLESRNWEHLI